MNRRDPKQHVVGLQQNTQIGCLKQVCEFIISQHGGNIRTSIKPYKVREWLCIQKHLQVGDTGNLTVTRTPEGLHPLEDPFGYDIPFEILFFADKAETAEGHPVLPCELGRFYRVPHNCQPPETRWRDYLCEWKYTPGFAHYIGDCNFDSDNLQDGDLVVSTQLRSSGTLAYRPFRLERSKISPHLCRIPGGAWSSMDFVWPYGAPELEPATYEDFKPND